MEVSGMKTIRVSGVGFSAFVRMGKCNLEFTACNTFAREAKRNDMFELKDKDSNGSTIVQVADKKKMPNHKIELSIVRAGSMA